MVHTQSNRELLRVEYYPRPDGTARVWLHEYIASEAGEDGSTVWSADEVSLETSLSEAEVEARFDELWVEAESEGQDDKARIRELEAQVGALTDVLMEVI